MLRKLLLLTGITSLSIFSDLMAQLPGKAFNPSRNTYAIVVGISGYRYIKPLSYADKDAELFADLLRSGAGGKIKEDDLFLLKNDSANAGNFWAALSRINNKELKKGDRVYIYFAGHGDGVKGLNEYYLLLSDIQPANDGNNYLLSFSAIDMYKLKNRIGLMTSKGVEVILILDACRTNELAGGYASQVFSNSIVQTKVGEIAMLATGPGQVSIEDASFGPGHGLFTYNLVDALSGMADKEDGDNNSIISLGEINHWVSRKTVSMSARFKVKQIPVFCCDDKNNTTIGIVDSGFTNAWNELKQRYSNKTTPPLNAQRNNTGAIDTNLLGLYNRFNIARKEHRLWGENSADSYYNQMQSLYSKEKITEDARYALASDFINFAQEKINLYLEGKDLLSVGSVREKADSAGAPSFLSDNYDRMEKALSEKWTITALMIQKAGRLLSSNNDSTFLFQLKPKINFLLARGYISGEKENKLNFEQALDIARQAYSQDSSAAYAAECLGMLYAYRNSLNRYLGLRGDNEFDYELGINYRLSDTSMRYFKKAISLAPGWVSPYRSIGLKIFGDLNTDSATTYIHKAITLNPQDGTSYVIMGDLYYRFQPDSAIYYYKQALDRSGRSSHARIYRKMARVYLITFTRNSPRFKPDSVLYYSKLAMSTAEQYNPISPLDRNAVLRDVYISLADAYNELGKKDSVTQYWFKVIDLFPDHLRANRYLFPYYMSIGKPDSAFWLARRVLALNPAARFVYVDMAKYFDGKKMIDSAIYYYKASIVAKWDVDYCREKIAFLLMDKDKNDEEPLVYFNQMLAEVPSAWRQYYNIAGYYANRGDADKAIEYLEKAVGKKMQPSNLLLKEKWFNPIRETGTFKAFLSKYKLN